MNPKRSLPLALALMLPVVQSCATAGSHKPASPATPAGAVTPGNPTPVPGSNGAAQPAQVASANNGSATAPRGSERKTIESSTKGSRKVEGLFTVYQDTTNGSLHMLVPKDKIDREFIYFSHVVDAPVTAGRFRGELDQQRVFKLRKHFSRIELVTQNTSFWFDPASPLARAANANISPATVAVQEIIAEDNGAYLIKADDIFLSEALTQVKPTPRTAPGAPPRFTLGGLSRAKSRVLSVKNYPANTDVTVEYVYENPAPIVRGGEDVTDPRNVSIVVQHSVVEMPDNDYEPRFDDPRVGFFTVRVTDMLSPSATPYRDLITRWDLRKKDPSATISEPVEPIVFWIENTTPLEFRDAIREGVLRWNAAFEVAGFSNAMQVNVQPDDAEWDAGDLRYNVLRWTSSPNPPFGGYGPSYVNPRTGQILGADIMLEYVYVTNRVKYERLYSRAALFFGENAEGAEGDLDASRLCSYGELWQSNLMLGRQALEARGATPIEVREMIHQSLIELVMHEVGHTLGLNHNMKASQAVPLDRIHDRGYTEQHGTMGSVMDYSTINLAGAAGEQGEYYMTKAGAYDVWAIQHGYTPPLDDAVAEQQRIEALLARSTEPQLAFGNDADDMRSPGSGIDPRVNVSDLSDDAIGYMSERFEVVDGLISKLAARYGNPGQSYHELRSAYLILSGQQSNAANVIARYIGGVHVDRGFAGQPGTGRPFTPVSRAEQKRAMRALDRYVFSPDAFKAPEELYGYLQMQRRGFDFFGTTEDPKIHERVLNIQRGVLAQLLHPRVLTRITDSRQYGNGYPVTEVMSDLTDAIFAADARRNVNTFRQQLQFEYVNQLAAMVGPGTKVVYDYPSQSAAFASLQAIQRMLRDKSGVNAETTAHTRHVLFTIEKALKTN